MPQGNSNNNGQTSVSVSCSAMRSTNGSVSANVRLGANTTHGSYKTWIPGPNGSETLVKMQLTTHHFELQNKK